MAVTPEFNEMTPFRPAPVEDDGVDMGDIALTPHASTIGISKRLPRDEARSVRRARMQAKRHPRLWDYGQSASALRRRWPRIAIIVSAVDTEFHAITPFFR